MPILPTLVRYGFDAMIYLILAWALLSWFQPKRTNPLVRILDAIVEPILYPFQKLIPPIGGISLSAFAAILVLSLIRGLILNALQG